MIMGKPQVAYGYAVWKHYRQSNVARENTKTFFFTVIFEQPERIVVQDIQTNRADFDRMYEGVPVIVARKGSVVSARIYQ